MDKERREALAVLADSDGMVRCPKRWSTLARDRCIEFQANTHCGVGCAEGRRAILERMAWDKAQDKAEPAEAAEKAANRRHYQRYKKPKRVVKYLGPLP